MREFRKVELGTLIKPAKIKKCGKDSYPVLSMTMHDGLVFQSDKFKKSVASQDTSEYKVVYRNQLVISFPIDEGVLATQRIIDAGIVSPAYGIWDVDESQILPEFLEYCLRCKRALEYYKAKLRGSTARRRSLPTPTLLAFQIQLPSLKDQEEILYIINKCKTIIEFKKNQITELNMLIKARFVEMFGNIGTDEYGWGYVKLGECCEINPKKGLDNRLHSDLEVSFVPMSAVSENGVIDSSEVRSYNDVKSGFTYFTEKDVLFAKITPCMENGKGAVAIRLMNGIGFGSTEFHVLRPITKISNPYWIYYVTVFEQFRQDAESNMTGSAGQRRVPVSFLENYRIALPPIELQEQFAEYVHQVNKSKVAIFTSVKNLVISLLKIEGMQQME